MTRPCMATEPTPRVREALVAPLRRAFGWHAGLRGGDGRIVCPWHGVEHTGSNAGLVVTALELLRHDPQADGEALRRTARSEAARLVANLVREGDSPCHTFRPGRHDPFNASNGIIDGGACADALAELVQVLGPELPAAEREAARQAALLHARTYLRYAVLDKGVPAQRAWGLTGLAQACRLERDAELERAALEALAVLGRVQHADGSVPYHPLEWGAEHPGAADVSSFYQSRVSAFTAFAQERLGLTDAGPTLPRALEFLAALQGPDGLKCGLVEAKPWYWSAHYEVASHPFDVYAFAAGARRTGVAQHAQRARLAYDAWSAHLADDGRPRDHLVAGLERPSYQCPVFWAGHAAWIARALPELERAAAASAPPESPAPRIAWFPDAQLARLDDGCVAAWVRGARPPFNVNHGSPRSGLLRVHARARAADVLAHEHPRIAGPGEWTARAGGWSPARGWRNGASELRFALWIARVHARAGHASWALAEPWRTLRRGVLSVGSPELASCWAREARATLAPRSIELRTALAHRDGRAQPGAELTRRFEVDGRGLRVDETLAAGCAAEYAVPAEAREVERGPGSVRYRLA